MNRNFKFQCLPWLVALVLFQCTGAGEKSDFINNEIIDQLPFQQLSLNDLDAFQVAKPNWQIVGKVTSDFENGGWQTNTGTGILSNQQELGESDLLTQFAHGDMELDIEFMVPKGSNSGIYFQSRYELQILDSWRVESPTSADCGGIYERWDERKSEDERGYEGYPPSQNASLAPGLWQHFHVKFRAPRFDASGKKIANARFDEVIFNGVKIHENVELSGPTRGATDANEVARAPLRFQGDHGKVAFRNFRYKLYGKDTLTTSNVTYQYFEIDPPLSQLPNFDSLKVIETGSADVIDVNALSKRGDGVAFKFQGDLEVKRTGDYLFRLSSDDGSRLFINEELLIDHDGNHDLVPKRGLIHLEAGIHSLQIDYFNNVWGKGLMLEYEGPELERQILQGLYPYSTNDVKEPLLVNPGSQPELIRSFFDYREEKRTHVISVGHPEGIHYAYDLKNGSLLSVWRGDFADVTDMWQGRGHGQRLMPPEVALVMPQNTLTSADVTFHGYELEESGHPVFMYQKGESMIYDAYRPHQNGLKRTLWMKGGDDELEVVISSGVYMDQVNEHYFSMDGRFYLNNLSSIQHKVVDAEQQRTFVFPLSSESQKIEYSILW